MIIDEKALSDLVEAACERALRRLLSGQVTAPDEMLSADAVGERTSTTGAHWRGLARRREIKATRVGRNWRFRWADVDAYMSKR